MTKPRPGVEALAAAMSDALPDKSARKKADQPAGKPASKPRKPRAVEPGEPVAEPEETPAGPERTVALTVRVPESLRQQLRVHAMLEGALVQEVVIGLLTDWVGERTERD